MGAREPAAASCFSSTSLRFRRMAILVQPNLMASLQTALGHHRAGRLVEAEQLYRAVLRAEANDADALNLLGVLEYQRGRNLEALEWLTKAIQASPKTASFHNNLGLVLVALHRHGEAARRFEQAGQLDDRLHDAFYNLGVARQQLGQVEAAIAAYLKALSLAEEPGTLNNLGAAYLKSRRREEAMQCYERALQLHPNHADALFNIAVALSETGRKADAETRYQQALFCYRQELMRQPTAPVCVNLAHILLRQCAFLEAEELLRRALQLQPDHSAAFNGLGNLLLATGRAREAVEAYDRAIQLREHDAHAYYNRGHARLVLGDFAGGWDDYEYRWLWEGFPYQRPPFARPEWNGDDLNGRTLLVFNEQGLGDTIQFARYLRLLANRGARVLFAGPAELKSLLGDLDGACQVLDAEQPPPPFDVHAALLSLPRLCGTRLDNIPAAVPYLPLPPVERFPLPPATPGRLRVGLVWAGGAIHLNDKLRSIPLQNLLPLLQTADCDFFSLQVGPRTADLAALPAGISVTDVGSRVRDLADTAAVMRQLDLIISVDTATLHLAGALARPAWALLPYAPDWRWLLQREDSPWYPTLRLFRQAALGDWAGVITRVREELNRVGRLHRESGMVPPQKWFLPSPCLSGAI
jgi:tetratricopeptide (TPR) repeat protein